MIKTEININPAEINKDCMDEWGVATAYISDDWGIEYNLCYDNGICESAFYPYYKRENGEYETDTSCDYHYEINFDDPDWKFEMTRKMIDLINKRCLMDKQKDYNIPENKTASELGMDLTKERVDFAVMTALYVGNLSAQIDPTEWSAPCDYDSFDIINDCIKFANEYDFDMEFYNNEWVIDTGLAREAAFKFAEQEVKKLKEDNMETKYIRTEYAVNVYNKYHDGFEEQIDVFPTYEEAIEFIAKGDFDLDKDSEYVEIVEIEYENETEISSTRV